MVSKHYKNKRREREKFINECLNGSGNVIDSFIVDKGHINGLERHDITDNGIIIVYNAESGLEVTKLIARPQQIKRYYYGTNKRPHQWLLDLCAYHQSMGYNEQ